MKNILSIIFLGAVFGLGFGLSFTLSRAEAETIRKQQIVICESGALEFENGTKEDKADFYFVSSGKCNLGDSNGPEVTVKVID